MQLHTCQGHDICKDILRAEEYTLRYVAHILANCDSQHDKLF